MLVAEHKTERRVVRLYTGGVREVVIGDSEYWSRYVIVPRKTVVAEIRKMKAKGFRRFDSLEEYLPEQAYDLMRSEHYGGPGRAFVRAAHKHKSGRKWVVYAQSGGLDI